jgi:hypothetical protein
MMMLMMNKNIQCWRTADTPDLLRLSKNGIEARGHAEGM